MDGVHVTPMHIAAGNGDIKIVQLLKDKNADCTKLDNSQVYTACGSIVHVNLIFVCISMCTTCVSVCH